MSGQKRTHVVAYKVLAVLVHDVRRKSFGMMPVRTYHLTPRRGMSQHYRVGSLLILRMHQILDSWAFGDVRRMEEKTAILTCHGVCWL